MSKVEKLIDFGLKKKCTLLGIGPMSKNCIDVTIELANKYNVPIMLIASRRQIESNELGGGYVNNWTTEEFSEYVKKRDLKKNIILCRDHGGPFQGINEDNLTLEEAINNAKSSFLIDIKSDFEILHIDPSGYTKDELEINKMLEIIYELYEYCHKKAIENNKKVSFEISIGREDGGVHKSEEIKFAISQIEEFCAKKRIPNPLFVVVKTGNYVMETRNIGIFEEMMSDDKNTQKMEIGNIIDYLNAKDIMLKEHNADYISNDMLKIHPKIGIHAMNVAPEFGVVETRAMLKWFTKNNLNLEKEKFLDLSLKSNKWKKWMVEQSSATDNDKAVIAGHYVLSNMDVREIIDQLEMKKDLLEYVKEEIRISIKNYLKCLELI